MMNRRIFAKLTILAAALAISGAALAAEPIRIGSPLLLSGNGAFVGGAEKNTLEMMAEKVNKAGGINGRPLKFIYYDTEAKPDVAVRLVNRLIRRDKVDAILGISTSWTALPVIPIIEKHRVPTIMLGSANKIVNPVRKWVFKTPADDTIVVAMVLNYLRARGIGRIALMSTQDGFGDGGRSELLAHSSEYGIKIVFDDRYTMEDTDVTPSLNKIRKTDAQAVVNWSSRRAPVIFTMNYRQMGLKLPLFHSHAVLSKSFLKATGQNADGIKVAAIKFFGAEGLPAADPQKRVILGYQADYKKKFGKEANQFGAAAFDGFNILVAALKQAGTDKARLRDSIERTRSYVGINGVFSYAPGDHGGLTKESLVMYQASAGAWNVIQ